jgi:hypothetical protein
MAIRVISHFLIYRNKFCHGLELVVGIMIQRNNYLSLHCMPEEEK